MIMSPACAITKLRLALLVFERTLGALFGAPLCDVAFVMCTCVSFFLPRWDSGSPCDIPASRPPPQPFPLLGAPALPRLNRHSARREIRH